MTSCSDSGRDSGGCVPKWFAAVLESWGQDRWKISGGKGSWRGCH